MQTSCAIVLAAGDGKRMKSDNPKVLSEVLFKPMIKWTLDSLKNTTVNKVCIVGGYNIQKLYNYLYSMDEDYDIAIQNERKGTAHAVMMAEHFLRRNIDSDVFVLNGDAPFIDSNTIKGAYDLHKKNGNSVTVISAEVLNPFGYGRIIRDRRGNLTKIVEQKDATNKIQTINEVNSGAYWFNVKDLLDVLFNIKNENSQNEYYLPDSVKLIIKNKLKASVFKAYNPNTVLGANDCLQLNKLNEIARKNILNALMLDGVSIPFTDGVVIGPDVKIGKNNLILPGTIIKGSTCVGDNCTLGPNSFIDNCVISDNVILDSVNCSSIEFSKNTKFGPYKNITVGN